MNTIIYYCKNCKSSFNVPAQWEERHGLSTSPYEVFSGCPNCLECGYAEIKYYCDYCSSPIVGEHIKLYDDMRICEKCYKVEDYDEY